MRATQLLRRGRAAEAGFSLMELMVGLTIGMIAMVVIIQVMSFFEAQRRTTSGTADAQTNGGIALYAVARDLQMAGYPLMATTDSPLGCTTLTSNVAGITSDIARIAPAAITNGTAGGSPASDSITIRFGTTLTGGAPAQINSLLVNPVIVSSNLGCQANDITLIMSGATCAISRATAVSAPAASPISVTLENTALAAANNNLSCLGTWNEVTYAVNAGNLERTAVVNGVSGGAQPLIAGIVNLQAQYGIAASASSNQITQWVDASGGTWAAPTVANRNRIKAIRLAVVARNSRLEPDVVSAACTSTTAATPGGVCAWVGSVASPAPSIDLSTGNANWNRYRYRVFETIIPLRNVIWSKDSL